MIRTSETRHKQAVHAFWNKIKEAGAIYKGSYDGWYCVADEAFYSEMELVEHVNCNDAAVVKMSPTGRPVQWVSEENYIFRLTHYLPRIRDWITNNDIIRPDYYLPHVKEFLDNSLDFSVSRSADRIHWGIDVPGDSSQKIYVWLDALVNYLTVAGYPNQLSQWPPTVQVIGKDIIKFHAVYWPAFLMAADLPLPEQIFCHAHWTLNNTKMSKSTGNVVDPWNEAKHFGFEALRFFLIRLGIPTYDGDYSSAKVQAVVNNDLANNLGNLISRCFSSLICFDKIWPQLNCLEDICKQENSHGHKLLENLHVVSDQVAVQYERLYLYKAVDLVFLLLQMTNAYFHHQKPWILVKQISNNDIVSHHSHSVTLYTVFESLRISAILLQPAIPRMASEILDRLSVGANERCWQFAKVNCIDMRGRPVLIDQPLLFKRIVKFEDVDLATTTLKCDDSDLIVRISK